MTASTALLAPPPTPALTPPSTGAPAGLAPGLRAVLDRLAASASTNIGFPTAVDIDYQPLAPFLKYMINNLGDPDAPSTYPAHVKDIERQVLRWFADLYGAPPGCSGYVTGGGTEAILHALAMARTALPHAAVYFSRSAHYSVAKAARLLGLEPVAVAANPRGGMDYEHLQREACQRPGRPGIVVATIGSTMAEAVDDVARIHQALDDAGVGERWIHADAALGLHLALTHPVVDLAAPNGAHSVSSSGHKWFGTPIPCGIVLVCDATAGSAVPYLGCHDTTVSGSRSGLAALMLAHAIGKHDLDGHRRRAYQARNVAAYACRRLAAIGWPHWRNPHAVTVVLRPLPERLRQRWPLPIAAGWSHLICMPGVSTTHIDHLITDLQQGAPQ
jgi:histidine decarboxylase